MSVGPVYLTGLPEVVRGVGGGLGPEVGGGDGLLHSNFAIFTRFWSSCFCFSGWAQTG